MFTLPETLSPPIIALIAVAVLLVLFLLVRGMRAGGGADKNAEMIAAVQAERDTLRANHAVTVARLEEKLEDARSRLNENVAAVMAAKGSEAKIAALTASAEDLQRKLNSAEERSTTLQSRANKLTTEGANLNRLLADHESVEKAVEEQSQTISDLRRELQEAMKRATLATSAKANLTEERDELRTARDRLITDIEQQRTTITELRDALRKASTGASQQAGNASALEAVQNERDAALQEASKLNERVSALRTEMQGLADRLSQANAALNETRANGGELATLRENATHLEGLLREREATITELRNALGNQGDEVHTPSTDPAEAVDAAAMDGLRLALSEARAREEAAGTRLATVSGERDELKGRAAAAERDAESARVELEHRDATLELRVQKISELEHQVRDHFKDLHEARHRAEAAEAQLAGQPGGADLIEAGATVAKVQSELDAIRAENATLRSEINKAKEAQDADPTELQSALDTLARENAALRQHQRPGALLSQADVSALRAQLNQLAARFLDQAEGSPVEDAAKSLAERIRAFKAARAAGLEPGRR